MPGTTRTFVALPIPAACAEALARLQAELAPMLPAWRWAPEGSFHVTLAFLGDVANDDLEAVARHVAEAAALFGTIGLRIEGLGAFPAPRRPRVLWAGLVGDGLGPLAELQRAVAEAVRAAGYPHDRDDFHPHLTLARIKPDRRPADLAATLDHHRAWSAGAFTAAAVVTFASELSPHGARYTRLAEAPLAGGPDRSSRHD